MSDFSSITSIGAAENAGLEGRLTRVLLLPAELGGQDRPGNVVYIPPHLWDVQTDATVGLLGAVRQGMIEVAVVPEYRGASFVPARIVITATAPGATSGYAAVVEVW